MSLNSHKANPSQIAQEDQDARLETIQQGREAVGLMGLLRPYIESRVHVLVHHQTALYRSGQADFPRLLGIAAEISCMMNLLSDLDSKSIRGNVAMQKEYPSVGE